MSQNFSFEGDFEGSEFNSDSDLGNVFDLDEAAPRAHRALHRPHTNGKQIEDTNPNNLHFQEELHLPALHKAFCEEVRLTEAPDPPAQSAFRADRKTESSHDYLAVEEQKTVPEFSFTRTVTRAVSKVHPDAAQACSQPRCSPPPLQDSGEDPNEYEFELGNIGIKWRVRIVRIYDSEEEWKGVVEVFFHWTAPPPKDAMGQDGGVRHRHHSILPRSDIEIIERPAVVPVFKIMNDEHSTSTEEIYYRCPTDSALLFGFVNFTVTIHERLELEVSSILGKYYIDCYTFKKQ